MEFTPKEKIKNLQLLNQIDTDLAYFCGVLAGDGSIGYREKKKEYSIKCVGNPKDEIEFYNILIKNLIKKLFNLDINPKFHDKKTTYGFSLYSRSIVKYLTETIGLPLGKKYEKLKIPKIFLNNKALVRHFISGVADTDFHIAIKRNNYPVIIGTSKSENFIQEIKDFLDADGFRTFKSVRKYYDKRVNKLIITHIISIYGRKQFSDWLMKIGFRHPKNIKKVAGAGIS